MINLRNVLIAGAFVSMMVPAAASAEDCTFIPGDTVLQERGASDQRINQFLGDLGASRSGQTINARLFSEQVALTMGERNLAQNVTVACRSQLAPGFMKINNLPETITDQQFAVIVRSTGFRLPTMVAAAQAPAPPPAAVAASLPQPAVAPAPTIIREVLTPADQQRLRSLESERAELRKDIARLKQRPVISSTDRKLLDSLQGNLDAINTRIDTLTRAHNSLFDKVSTLRNDVNDLRTDVDVQGRDLGSLTWLKWTAGIALVLAILGIGFSVFSGLRNRKVAKDLRTSINHVYDKTVATDDELTSLTGVVQNATGQLGITDMVTFDHEDMAELKVLPEEKNKFVRVLINGSSEQELKVRFARIKGGQYMCMDGVDRHDSQRPISNPLAFVRESYRDGKMSVRVKPPGFHQAADAA